MEGSQLLMALNGLMQSARLLFNYSSGQIKKQYETMDKEKLLSHAGKEWLSL